MECYLSDLLTLRPFLYNFVEGPLISIGQDYSNIGGMHSEFDNGSYQLSGAINDGLQTVNQTDVYFAYPYFPAFPSPTSEYGYDPYYEGKKLREFN